MDLKDYPYHVLDETTPWYEFLFYQQLCVSLGREDRIGSFIRYHKYLKLAGIE